MLSPDVNQLKDLLAQAYSTITRVDTFAYAAINSTIGRLSPDPLWVGEIRNELVILHAAGVQWQQAKSKLWAPILGQFPSYSTLFAGVADVAKQLGGNRENWIQLLGSLADSLQRSELATKAAENDFKLQVNNLNNIQQVFSTSIGKAWKSLAAEEERMIAMAEQIGTLSEQLSALEADLSANAISSGKSYTQSVLTMSYEVLTATAAVSVPYLTVVGLVFTAGKQLYDVFSTADHIHATIEKIRDLSLEMTQEAQAAAMSKALIHLITGFDSSLAAVGRQLPSISAMWAAERQKVQGVIHALQAGADPESYLDLVALRPAAATWKTLSDFAARLLMTPPMGRPVALSTAPARSTPTPISA
jgi:hypothetical protein